MVIWFLTYKFLGMSRWFGIIGPKIDQIWAWLYHRRRWEVGVQDPLTSLVTGSSLLVNCYLGNKFHKKIRLTPPPLSPGCILNFSLGVKKCSFCSIGGAIAPFCIPWPRPAQAPAASPAIFSQAIFLAPHRINPAPTGGGGGGGGGGDRVPSCRHRAGGVGQFLAGMQFSTKVLKYVVICWNFWKPVSTWVLKC